MTPLNLDVNGAFGRNRNEECNFMGKRVVSYSYVAEIVRKSKADVLYTIAKNMPAPFNQSFKRTTAT